MPFDSESGLVYQERVQKHCDCLRRSIYNTPGEAPAIGAPHGSRSLRDMVKQHFLRNLSRLDARSLVGLPPQLLQELWSSVEERRLDSLAVWRLFVQSGFEATDRDLNRKWNLTCRGCTNLPDIVRFASDAAGRWLTHLKLGDLKLGLNDLVRVATLQNVRTIEMVGRSPGMFCMTDRVFRSWAEATTHGAFARLEMLYFDLRGFESLPNGQSSFSESALMYLDKFPKLKLLCVHKACRTNCFAEPGKVYGLFKANHGPFWVSMEHSGYLDWLQLIGGCLAAPEKASPACGRPCLDINIGLPCGRLPCEIAKLECFERVVGLPMSAVDTRPTEAGMLPARKRPRLRDTKTNEFRGLLDQL